MTDENASPTCYAGEADDRYAGFMTNDEVLGLLGTMLEAERAGAKVAQALEKEAGDPNVVALMGQVRRDEGRYCALLGQWIKRLGGDPGHKVGDFYEKVMALDDLVDRLALLNRGQGWVVRKLNEALPKIRDDALHADLKEMVDRHETNIADCGGLIGPHRANS